MQASDDKLTPAGVDRVVREVLAGMNGRHVGNGAMSHTAVARSAAVATAAKGATAPAKKTVADTSAASNCLTIDARVVSLVDVNGRLAGVEQLTVRPSAIVTPAVRDELRDRDIRLVRATDAAAARSQVAVEVSLAVVAKNVDSATIARQIATSGRQVQLHDGDCLAAAIDFVADGVTGRRGVGVIVADQAAAAMCLANRVRGVRAVAATSPEQTAAAATEVGANVLVVDLRGQSGFAAAAQVRRFLDRDSYACPGQWIARLG
ncbi:MAG: hypothetical protein R3C10_03485 [Pirellulales bacterium]